MADYTRLPRLQSETLKVTELDAPGVAKAVKLGQITYTATSGTAVKIGTVPADHRILKVWCEVTTAFNSGTSDTLKIGTATDDDAFLATGDITTHTAGCYKKDAFFRCATATDIKATLSKTGTAATAGVADIYVLLAKL